MKSIKILLLMLFVLVSINANAQDIKFNLDKLKVLETKAQDVVEVNLDGKVLDLAKRVLTKVNDKDAKNVGDAIKGLKGIYVRVYNFDKENEYNLKDIDDIRADFSTPNWERLVNVRSKKNNQKIDVFTRFAGDSMSGATVIMSESKSIAIINIDGMIDFDTLVEISGKLNIPKIEVESDETNTGKPTNVKKAKKSDNEN